ncbi:uncharacterized protein G2W53_034767 [Senna tora]|uniref:Uncharacterized protein n=1 Tax=Senna tora TaxID=362788 RepID=A0A834T1X8_9FABA|nr:uncharacterized protein G2W53_034767 [Senna tora]
MASATVKDNIVVEIPNLIRV